MQVLLDKDTITPALASMIDTCKRPKALYQAAAKTVQVEISKHLRKLQARGNIKGWPSQKFFAGKATSVEKNVGVTSVTDHSATVSISDPRFVHHITGGTVTAKRGKNIAIPLTAEAAAKAGKGSIRESMPGLFVVKFPRGLYLVRETMETSGRKLGRRGVKRARLFPMFKLVRSVTHQPHPENMPDPAVLGSAARTAIRQTAVILFKAAS